MQLRHTIRLRALENHDRHKITVQFTGFIRVNKRIL